jgi:DUF971 family protein
MATEPPIEIKKTGPREITVRWADGHTSLFNTKYLRAECMCANCVNEITGQRMLDPASISEEVTVTGAEHVGRYGVKFVFSDRHDDGIYTWERLRQICPCPVCKPEMKPGG